MGNVSVSCPIAQTLAPAVVSGKGAAPFRVTGPVADAMALGTPVVALESAVLTHGLPGPGNLDVYEEMVEAVRSAGALPAPVVVDGGTVVVGADADLWRRLGRGEGLRKVGLHNLPLVVAAGADGGTTVAATAWAAHRAGIQVFATGGIGGVHRSAERTFDISGDLPALARIPVCVVCSGAKAVLDLPRTVEMLETLGISVVGYRTDRFPAFVGVGEGLPPVERVESPEALARVIRARDVLERPSALLVVQPPPEGVAVPEAIWRPAVDDALARAEALGVRGAAVTPFLLEAMVCGTGGRSLEANRALLVANARLAARVAFALARAIAPSGGG